MLEENISHFDLCKKTAEKFVKTNEIALFEYQTTISNEHPDVLVFGNYSILFEIKVSRSDFFADRKKPHRKSVFYEVSEWELNNARCLLKQGIINNDQYHKIEKMKAVTKIRKEYPHLGKKRYYVCPEGLIKPEEIQNGFGLYWFKGDRFYQKKESDYFKSSHRTETRLICHALRCLKNDGYSKERILAKPY